MSFAIRCALGLLLLTSIFLALTGPSALDARAEEGETRDGPQGQARIVISSMISMPEFLSSVGTLVDTLFIWDPNCKEIESARISTPMVIQGSTRQVMEAIRTILAFHDLVIVESDAGPDGIAFVVSTQQQGDVVRLRPEKIDVEEKDIAQLLRQHGRYVTTTFALEHTRDVDRAREAIAGVLMGSRTGSAVALPDSQALVVTDFAPAVAQAWRVIQGLEARSKASIAAAQRQLEVVTLEHADAEDVARLMGTLFPAHIRSRHKASLPHQLNHGLDLDLRVLGDRRTNQVFLSGRRMDIEKALEAIERADTAIKAPALESAVIPLARLPVERAADAIKSYYGQQKGVVRPTVVAEPHTDTLLITATGPQLTFIKDLVKTLEDRARKQEEEDLGD